MSQGRAGMTKSRAALLAAVLLAGPATAVAEVDPDAAEACVAEHAAAGTSPADCVADAMSHCRLIPPDAPALASQCYRTAKDAWSQGIADRMERLRNTAPEGIAAIAGVEVKYDLLGGFLNCDRLRDLALLGDAEEAAIQREADRCAATATGLAHVRLLWRSRDLP